MPDIKEIIEIGKKLSEIPKNFNVHKTLKKIFDQRKKMFTEKTPIDWSTAELLAFGTLLQDGFSVRLSAAKASIAISDIATKAL